MKILAVVVIAALLSVAGARGHEKDEHHAPGPGALGQPPEYVHVLLNPLLNYGLGIAIVALSAALLARSKPAQNIALALVIVTSASAWLVQHFGHNAYERVRQISDEPGQRWLEEHMNRGERVVYVYYGAAILAIATLVSRKKFPKAAALLTAATLCGSVVALGLGVWTSKAGGQIRHPEFRTKAAPPTTGAPHEHGAPGQPHEQMQHEKMQPDDTTGGHKHGAPGQSAEKGEKAPPLPDTLEGVWKAIHEHHAELESAVSEKKFSDVQSHAQTVSVLAKRLVELSHPDHKVAVEAGVTKLTRALEALKQSAETGSELVMKNNLDESTKALSELEAEMKKH